MFINKTKNNLVIKSILFFILLTYNITVILAFPYYFGNILFFILLCSLINILLIYSFLKSNYFFNIFLSIFILFGFGFKFTLSLIFYTKNMYYIFSNPLSVDGGTLRLVSQHLLKNAGCIPSLNCPNFLQIIHNPDIYDRGIVISCVALTSFLFSMFLFDRVTKQYFSIKNKYVYKTSDLYEKNRFLIISSLGIVILFINFLNFKFNIYQKGITSSFDNLLLKPIVSWLLLFGLTSFVCHLLYSEFIRKKIGFKILLFFSFLEPFLSSTSMMSRGFVFNSLSLFLAFLKSMKDIKIQYLLALLFFISCLFISSLYITQNNRIIKFIKINNTNALPKGPNQGQLSTEEKKSDRTNLIDSLKNSPEVIGASLINDQLVCPNGYSYEKEIKSCKMLSDDVLFPKTTPFFGYIVNDRYVNFIAQVFIERWVGLEEVIITADYESLGWSFFIKSLNEKQSDNQPSVFDREIYKMYLSVNRNLNNFTSVPGFVAFSFFPNSYFLLLIIIKLSMFFCLTIELISRNASYNNIYFSALIGQVLAFRIAHFGVYPLESYKIILALFLTILISWLYSKLFLNKQYLKK